MDLYLKTVNRHPLILRARVRACVRVCAKDKQVNNEVQHKSSKKSYILHCDFDNYIISTSYIQYIYIF